MVLFTVHVVLVEVAAAIDLCVCHHGSKVVTEDSLSLKAVPLLPFRTVKWASLITDEQPVPYWVQSVNFSILCST